MKVMQPERHALVFAVIIEIVTPWIIGASRSTNAVDKVDGRIIAF